MVAAGLDVDAISSTTFEVCKPFRKLFVEFCSIAVGVWRLVSCTIVVWVPVVVAYCVTECWPLLCIFSGAFKFYTPLCARNMNFSVSDMSSLKRQKHLIYLLRNNASPCKYQALALQYQKTSWRFGFVIT